ncbi:MAG: tetratricopeptide repeat protein [Armatimonadota bacterium]|nr:tetratricopeptide repeat protein [Armatimonadota bacterium]
MEYFLGEEYSYEDMAGAILEAARQKVAANGFKSAIPLIHEVLRKSENQQLLAEGYHLLTVCLRCLGRLNEALLACETALEHFRTVGDRRGVTQTYLQIGALAVALEDFPRARQAYEQVLRYSKGLKSLKEDYIEALLHFGNTLLCLGDLDEVVLAYEEAFHESFRQGNLAQMGFAALGFMDRVASVLVDLAWYWIQRGDLLQAKVCCREALHLLDAKDNGIIRGQLYRVLGTIAQKGGISSTLTTSCR